MITGITATPITTITVTLTTIMDTITDTDTTIDRVALVRLMQLTSPALPVGSFAYSQGLEWAVEAGWVTDEETCAQWMVACLQQTLGRVDLPILMRMQSAWHDDDLDAVAMWSAQLRAWRETSELRSEERDRGRALARLLAGLGIREAEVWREHPHSSFAAGFSLAADRWRIPPRDAATAYAWAWLENLTINAVKLIPLGQLAGQRLLSRLSVGLPVLAQAAAGLEDDDIGGTLPALAIASARHETQYTRLYRS
jgi:urease accessory protein